MKSQILVLLLCLACLPASYASWSYVRVWTVMVDEDISKQLHTEDARHVPSTSARLGVYSRALPGYLLFAAPVSAAAIAPIVVAALLLTRLIQPTRHFRSAGWLLFAVSVASAGVLAFLGVIAGARGLPFLLLALLLVVVAFYPIVPVRSNATNVS